MDVLKALFAFAIRLLGWTWQAISWVVKRLLRLLRAPPDTFGRAKLASPWWLWRNGYLGNRGLIIGKVKWLGRWRFIRFADEGHATAVAPPRQGKGASFIIPNLLDHPGSVFVIDPKGENYDITSRRRRDFGPVYKIDALDPADSDQLNPLDSIRVGTEHEVDDAELIADLMVTPDTKSAAHWDDKSRMRLTGIILLVMNCRPPELRTLMEVRRTIMQDTEAFKKTLAQMETLPFETCRDTANDFLRILETGEGSSILSNMEKATKLWSEDRPVANFVRTSNFSLADFKQQPTSLYIMIPREKIAAYAPLMRMLTGLMLTALTRDHSKPAEPILVFLDECHLLGRLDLLPEMIALTAGYGIRVIPIWHGADVVRRLYGSEDLIKNCSVQLYFGLSDPDIAAKLSQRIGQITVHASSAGQTGDIGHVIQTGRSQGESESGRPLMYSSEIMETSDIFTVIPKSPVIRCKPVQYWKDRAFRGMWDKERS